MKPAAGEGDLSRRSRRQAIWLSERPSISSWPGERGLGARLAGRVIQRAQDAPPRVAVGRWSTAAGEAVGPNFVLLPRRVKRPCAPLPNRDRPPAEPGTMRTCLVVGRAATSARLEDHDRDLAIGPRLVGVVVAVEVDETRPQLGALGRRRRCAPASRRRSPRIWTVAVGVGLAGCGTTAGAAAGPPARPRRRPGRRRAGRPAVWCAACRYDGRGARPGRSAPGPSSRRRSARCRRCGRGSAGRPRR